MQRTTAPQAAQAAQGDRGQRTTAPQGKKERERSLYKNIVASFFQRKNFEILELFLSLAKAEVFPEKGVYSYTGCLEEKGPKK